MTVKPYREFYPRLSVSLRHIFQVIGIDYDYPYYQVEKIFEIFEDIKTHDDILCSSKRNVKYVKENYSKEYVEAARNIFKDVVAEALELNSINGEGIDISYTNAQDREFVNMTNLDCIVHVSFLTQESLNKFKLTHSKTYQQLIDFEKEMNQFQIRREKRLREQSENKRRI